MGTCCTASALRSTRATTTPALCAASEWKAVVGRLEVCCACVWHVPSAHMCRQGNAVARETPVHAFFSKPTTGVPLCPSLCTQALLFVSPLGPCCPDHPLPSRCAASVLLFPRSVGDMRVYFQMLDSLLASERLPPEYAGRMQQVRCVMCEGAGAQS